MRFPSYLPCRSARKAGSVLDRLSSAHSLEEKFGAGSGTASTEAEYVEVPIGGGSGWEELQRRGVHTLVQRTLRTRHECPGIVSTTHEKRVRKDWNGSSQEYWCSQQPPCHHCGHFRTSRSVIVMGAVSLDENCTEGFERQRVMRCQISGELEYAAQDTALNLPEIRPCSECPAPTLSQTSIGRRRPKFQLSSPGTGSGRAEDGEEQLAVPTENAPRQERESLWPPPRRQLAKAGLYRCESCPSSRTTGQGGRGAKSKDGQTYRVGGLFSLD